MDFYLRQAIVTPGAKPFSEGETENELGEYHNCGFDIYAVEPMMIAPLSGAKIHTGIVTEFPYPYVGLIFDRGSTGMKGMMRRAGVVDPNFRGEWIISLFNSSDEMLLVESILENPNAKACAQVVFLQYGKKKSIVVPFEQLSKSKRGANWLGSTDKK